MTAQTQDLVALDENKKLSESIIWRMLENFYDTASISAWDKIPFYPTSNPFIAETYAEMIIAFLKDCREKINPNEPLYIVEMAAGSGCFSFYLLKELKRKLTYFEDLGQLKLSYVMVDFTENNVNNWRASAKLKPFVDEGLLQFGLFRPEDDKVITLRPEGILSKEQVRNPVIAIANYFFDSIKQDAFQISDGKLHEARHSFFAPSESALSPRFEALVKSESYTEVSFDYFDDPELNKILTQYRDNLKEASVLLPVGTFSCVRNLLEISDRKLVLLSSDKGFTDESYCAGKREQVFLAHHGIFSYSVNYDAVKKYFENQGGACFTTSDDNLSVSTCAAYLLDGWSPKLENSRYYFQEKVDKQNVSNYLYFLQDILTATKPDKSNELLRACLGFIQLCNFDPIVFSLAAPRIYAALETITRTQQDRLLKIIDRVRDNFYSVQQQFDVFYWIGRVYYGLDMIEPALIEFHKSKETFGASSSSLYYIAACHEIKKDWSTALSWYVETLKLEPECEYTQSGIERMRKKLVEEKQAGTKA